MSGEDELQLEERRIFLGWERPLLEEVVEWLLAHKGGLPRLLVVVPTAQAGRRLRERLAESGGVLAPRVMRPEGLLPRPEQVAGRTAELVAWVEVLEGVENWTDFTGAFPAAPGVGEEAGWAMGLARSLAELSRLLRDGGLTLREAGRRMKGSEDGARWEALGRLEERVEERLREWGLVPRSQAVLRGTPEWPDGLEQIVVAGVADLGPVAARVLGRAPAPVKVLVGAPEEAREGFDPWGRPVPEWWERREVALAEDAIHIGANAAHQAALGRECVAARGTPSRETGIGTCDPGVTPELRRSFGAAGWALHDPAGRALAEGGLMAWLGHWREFVVSGRMRDLAVLLTGASAGRLMKKPRYQLCESLATLRSVAMPQDLDDLQRLATSEGVVSDQPRAAKAAREVWAAIQPLLVWRNRFRKEGILDLLESFLAVIGPKPGLDEEADDLRVAGEEFLEEAAGYGEVLDRRGEGFALALFRQVAGGRRRFEDPSGSVLDVQGWIELPFDPAPHLVVCGLNEGFVPERLGGEPWLNENARQYLGLETERSREARDAWLLTSLVEPRRVAGRVDLVCGRVSPTGEALLPSRFLMRCGESDLAGRVRRVFQTPATPDAGIPWERDWKLRAGEGREIESLSVTSFSAYLACPFRFHLSRVLRMEHPDVDRLEWDAREYGTVAHEVLERFGRDEEAREFSKTEAIADWFGAELARIVAERHGPHPPMAVRIQEASLRQRLGYLARVQACQRAEGWRITDVERKFELTLDGMTVRGTIDRIERHQDGGWRVSDYKTGGEEVRKAHLTARSARTRVASHVEGEKALEVEVPALRSGKLGKPAPHVWRNLQLPLYAAAWREECGELPEVGYFMVGKAEGDVHYKAWPGFDEQVVEAARACATMVVGKVRKGVFWPPEQKVTYDDFAALGLRRPLIEAFEEFATKGGRDA